MALSDFRDYQQQITIRKAGLQDASNIVKLGSLVFSLTFGHSVPSYELQAYLDEAYTIEAISKDLTNPMKNAIVATDQNHEILGFAFLTRGTSEPCIENLEDKVELQRIYVDSTSHGKGIGSLLARSIEEIAKNEGFKNIWLGVWEENHIAQKAYKRWGYKHVGEHDFEVGSVVQTDYIMVKSL
ncbi:hypothetical protein B7463_g2192, partial [Scytalidium lignicola]